VRLRGIIVSMRRLRQLSAWPGVGPRIIFLSICAAVACGSLVLRPGFVGEQTSLLPGARAVLPASAPRVVEHTFWSPALKREMPYKVYLPPGYDSRTNARYPVLYMLHGLGGDYTDWERAGLFTAASELVQRGEIPPMIIVTPEGERGYWMDHANNGPRFGTYFTQDLVSGIDEEYRTIADRESRAVGGMSMGGHGALQLALNNPHEFGIVGAHSVALRRKDQAFAFFGDDQYFQTHDPVSLCQRNQAVARRLAIWIDIGSADSWFEAANRFHEQLEAAQIRHSWHVFEGGHNAGYWQSHLADYLRFYGAAFESSEAGVSEPNLGLAAAPGLALATR
jgi:enterochelin esterase-like enzyme